MEFDKISCFWHRKRQFRPRRANLTVANAFLGVLEPISPFSHIFSHFHTFCSTTNLEPESDFGRKKTFFCVFGRISGSFLHPSANLTVANGFFGVLGILFPFSRFLAHFAFLAPKMHFWGQNGFGLKKRSWSPKGAFWASWAPSLAGWEPAREEREQRRAGGPSPPPIPSPSIPPPGAPHLTPITGGGLFGIGNTQEFYRISIGNP